MPFSKFVKHPQTKFQADTMSHSIVIRCKMSKCFVKSKFSCSRVFLFIDILLKPQQHTLMCFCKVSLQFWNIMLFCDVRHNNVVFFPLLDDWILSRLGVVRHKTWSCSACFGERSTCYAHRNFEGNNVMHYVMLKYNNVEPSQWHQDFYWDWIAFLCFRINFRPWFVASSFVGSLTLRFLFHFNRIQIFCNLPLWFLTHALYSAFQLQTQQIDRSK